MGESQGPAGEKVMAEEDRTPEQVREEIEHTRSELGDTVAELAAKTDVKAQAQRAVDNAKVQTHAVVHNAKATAAPPAEPRARGSRGAGGRASHPPSRRA